jgi:hypothetical protein
MSYGPRQTDSYREAGPRSQDEKLAELPVLVSTTFNFAINLQTAKHSA